MSLVSFGANKSNRKTEFVIKTSGMEKREKREERRIRMMKL
jgi:hypothetical protein